MCAKRIIALVVLLARFSVYVKREGKDDPPATADPTLRECTYTAHVFVTKEGHHAVVSLEQ